MKNLIFITLGVAFLALLGGCASTPYSCGGSSCCNSTTYYTCQSVVPTCSTCWSCDNVCY